MMRDEAVIDVVRRHAVQLDLDTAAQRLLDAIDPNVSLVLIGEASHGTHEFYRIRADLTRALIRRRGFQLVAVEADWPDAYRANQWVRLVGDDDTAEDALSDFTRFPRWMWRNRDVVRFLRWLRAENGDRPADARIGFYGLDLYSLHRSIACVIEYLDKVDPDAAQRARRGYACFDVFGEDVQSYGYATSLDVARSCEDEVIAQLVELRRRTAEYATRDGRIAADAYFVAEQNARVVRDAEMFYRAMFRGAAESWNVRDRHMMTTLEALLEHVGGAGEPARAVVWAHNSHLGDARATSMAAIGEVNLGQLARQRFGAACCTIGMTTHDGDVTAAGAWHEPAALRRVRPSLAGSYERLFHETGLPSFLLRLSTPELASALAGPRLERAIGVIYRPETERASHYFSARLPGQFDLLVHVDRTRALEPLERWSRHEIDLPETYPTGV
jgi:erythromycin esterase-like protein